MSGILITLTGYCQPFLIAGGVLSAVGAALVYTLDIDSSAGEYLGYQAIMGAGVGLCIQVPVIAAQAFCDPADIAPATAIVLCEFFAPHLLSLLFLCVPVSVHPSQTSASHKLTQLLLTQVFQTIGGALFVSAAESIFGNRLLQSVSTNAPGVDPILVLHTGASEIRTVFLGVDLPGVLSSYMLGLKGAWALGLALAAGAVVASFGPRRNRIRRKVASEAAA
jgi:MFS transporter, DHA2 family, glioxin efflux transporter